MHFIIDDLPPTKPNHKRVMRISIIMTLRIIRILRILRIMVMMVCVCVCGDPQGAQLKEETICYLWLPLVFLQIRQLSNGLNWRICVYNEIKTKKKF